MPPKKDVARALLLRGSVFVHLDPRIAGMVVPQWLRSQPQLVLQIGLDMPIPIPDLRVDDDGVYGTLSFQRSPFTCKVPWSGIFALVGEDGRGMVWPEDLPAEIAAEVDREVSKKPRLETIDGDRKHDGGERERLSRLADGRDDHRPRKKRDLPPYLRVIK
jgi:stringent starvation protein B